MSANLTSRVLGLIPARGGSKGVPRKNAKLMAGKPLIAWTVEAALGATRLEHVILSTEDEEIAAIGQGCGVDVPFQRSDDLASDKSPMIDVVLDALQRVDPDGEQYDAVCLLQPTNPTRTSADIDAVIELFTRTAADTVFTVLPVPAEHHPDWTYVKSADGGIRLATGGAEPIARRQDLRPAFHREGSVYVTRTEVLRERRSLYGDRIMAYPADAGQTVNIDTPADWDRAQTLLAIRCGDST